MRPDSRIRIVCVYSVLTLCNTLQQTTTHCNKLLHTATRCSTLQHTAPYRNTRHHAATRCNTMHHIATHYHTLQHTATQCNTLQHTPTHCTTLMHCVPTLCKLVCFLCMDVTWLIWDLYIRRLNTTHSEVGHDSFICAMWQIESNIMIRAYNIYVKLYKQIYVYICIDLCVYMNAKNKSIHI